MIFVILVEPQEPGNVGAVARAMANFEVKGLVLINPKCDHLCEEARRRAVHAGKILEDAKIIRSLDELGFDYLIATTSKMGSDYNIQRLPLIPKELAKKVNNKNNIGLVFGRESSGLTNQEIEKCSFTVAIPASKKYYALNLSHAVSIILYELFQNKDNITKHVVMATKKELDIINENLVQLLDKTQFSTKYKQNTQKLVWKRLFSKAMLTKREAFAVIGLLKKFVKNR